MDLSTQYLCPVTVHVKRRISFSGYARKNCFPNGKKEYFNKRRLHRLGKTQGDDERDTALTI